MKTASDLCKCVINPRKAILILVLILAITVSVFATPCGDVDNSGQIDITDAVYLINYIFAGGQAPQDDAAGNLDCNNQTDITDAVFMINYIFAAGPEPCSSPTCAFGVLLTGDPDALATTATYNYGPFAADSGEVDTTGLIATRLTAIVHPGASVAEVNAALASVGGLISWMTTDDIFLTIAIPAVSSETEADSIANFLMQSGAFLYAYAAYAAGNSSESEIVELPETGDVEIFHLTEMRMPAAWNVKQLAESVNSPVKVLVPDQYYIPTQHPEIPSQQFLLGRGVRELVHRDVGNHGFATSGIIGARHDAINTSGVHPTEGLLRINSIMLGGLTFVEALKEISNHFPPTHFVLNTSLGYITDFSGIEKLTRLIEGIKWRAWAQPRQNDFFHAAAASNEGLNTDDSRYAVYGSPFTVAASFDSPFDAYTPGEIGLIDSLILDYVWDDLLEDNISIIVKLNNVLVVGSSNNAGNESPFSCKGAPVRFVGENVSAPCYRDDPDDVLGGCAEVSSDVFISHYFGTSLAAPQAAGLAAYMLNLDPLASNNQLKEILYSAYDNSNSPGVVDAYLAVLGLDENIGTAFVRPVLLDIVDETFNESPDGKFDEYDVQAFLSKFYEYEQLRLGVSDAPADYSRYDLNGDGYTGGDNYIARFDLDINDPPQFTTASVPFDGGTLLFDENTLVDKDILCYYARTSLYSGNDSLAELLLSDCPCAQSGRNNSQCAGCDRPIQNLVQYVSRTGYMQAYASCNDCGCYSPPGIDSLPDGPNYFFGEWSASESGNLSCTSIEPSCASSAQSTLQSSPVFDTVANRWTFTVVQSGSVSSNQPCQAISIALENWRLTIADSCEMKYSLRLMIQNGELHFQGRFDPPQESINLSIGTFIPGTPNDTTISGELGAGDFYFNYLAGHYSGNIRLEFTIEPSQPSRGSARKSIVNALIESKKPLDIPKLMD